ncbi:DUF935 domain-containing protein [Humitalea sp. 24SJ18S-53]|uniref:DUF935 domain-containing protein n=1 Tax=Humitalea sp. 24SJ18S-53 TaxID=3422307 RepID=UPI003D66673B
MAVYGPDGLVIPAADIARLREDKAGPTLSGVRSPISGHPAEGLTPHRLAAIHRAAALGDALSYLELAEDIEERDLHYSGVLGTRKRSVAQLPMTVEAASDDPNHVKHADFLRAWLREGVLEAALFDLLDGVGKGFSVLEIMWRTEPGAFLPEALLWRPQRYFEVSREDGDTLALREATGLEPLAPHKFIVHRHPSKSGLMLRSGLARLASWAWMYKAFTLRDWAVFTQNFGQPMRLGRYGPGASDEDRRTLWRAVANIAGDCAAIVPKDMEIEFVEVKGLAATTDNYERRADWFDRQVSKAVLGQTTTTDAISGGHAVAKEHRLVQEDIERADARLASSTLTRQLAHTIIAFNFGPQKAYPSIRVGRSDEVPLPIVIEALKGLVPLGLRVEASEVRDRLGFSEPSEGEGTDVLGLLRAAPPPPAPEPPPSLNAMRRLLTSRHATQPDPDLVEAMVTRLARDAEGAMAGLTGAIEAEFAAASDLPDLLERITRLSLSPEDLARAMGRAMAIAHLAGEAAVLDELRTRQP